MRICMKWFVIFSVCFCLFICLFYMNGWKGNVVLTNSMAPTIPEGSLVITKPLSKAESLSEKIVLFYHPALSAYVLHRVKRQQVSEQGKEILIQTKGDANRIEDPLKVQRSDMKGVYVWHIPKLGMWLYMIKKYGGIIVALLLLVLLCKRAILSIFLMFALLLLPLEAKAVWTEANSAQGQLATGSGFFFYYLLNSTDTRQPTNNQQYVSTGQNATLSLDVGSLSGITNLHTTILHSFTIMNKTKSQADVSLAIENVSQPFLSLVGANYIVSVPKQLTIQPNETASIPLQITFLPLLTISGTYQGMVTITDDINGYHFQIPLTLRVRLL
ncbi:signal peptidase I [Anoxybacillus rupiensis]|uniref:signal peptidase I n=1 Tax=Anoxybacteroides rupiense TaxID=311460 RepID=UPI001BAA1A1B|nr:signal peptidase I [Anoxybacillus rupiensis]MBS2770588.1 signal peptidase I [Anoxybacillus rupiensis]